MGKKISGPFSGHRIDTTSKRNNFPTFFIIQRISQSNETFHGVSPFLVEKALTSSIGDAKSTKNLRSGDLLIEVESPKQAKEITKLKSLSTIPVTVPLRGGSSLDVTGFTTRGTLVSTSSVFCLPLSFFAIFFFSSRVGEGALHEKQLPLCLLLASHGQQITPTCWPCVVVPLDGWYISVPGVSIGRYLSHLAGLLKGIKRKSHSLGLGVKGGQRSCR
ncbi:hypothetical protein AVEN_7618-1 [Araneus ventricosus]|uniref:Uncharacterized protein n=1 Tax=Araneus ventricosus TaxID=182803 RepID=A0A4Y2N3B2_ARAVE|nr:hypothetical protein AVEN_7618-1 [Araneus ventricosus]